MTHSIREKINLSNSWIKYKRMLQTISNAASEGYLVTETMGTGTGKKQVIKLPDAINPNNLELEDKKIICAEEVKTIAKRCLKLEDSLKKGYTTVYNQCLQEVGDKLKSTDNWEKTQKEQSLHKLIQKIEQVFVGFDNHKQEIFNVVQALKMLFLYTQRKRSPWRIWGPFLKSLKDGGSFGGVPRSAQGIS